ncbi:hypothetical protein M8J77_002228 [Diaphorina citri]|nr:hypothetical protein M8J77_002228 [Diaphorina citri]
MRQNFCTFKCFCDCGAKAGGVELLGENKKLSSQNRVDKQYERSGELEFEEFVQLAAQFLSEDEVEDAAAMEAELKEAFRLYDKEGNGYITTDVLREILKELDDKISADDLDMMIAEIDSDGSGTVDFDEFMEVMTGGDD